MSSPEALAAVTKALQNLLSGELGGASVTTKPPSVARNGETGDQLNIFLYSVRHSPAFRNDPLPGKTKSGELAFPPLPLMLKYLITAYGKGDDDIYGQALLGKAMSILHDHPLLNRAEVDSGLDKQTERLRITPDPLTLDDMSKLWSSFQSAEYRLSAGYEVSVVLIDSKRSGKAPLPVLKRGEGDRGANVQPSVPPSLTGLRFLNHKPAAELGSTFTLFGKPLINENVLINIQHILLKNIIPLLVRSVRKREETESDEIDVEFPPAFAGPPGFYMLSLSYADKPELTSNQLAMPIAAKITSTIVKNNAGKKEIIITCEPKIIEKQKVVLLLGDKFIPMIQVTPFDPAVLKFDIKDIIPGKYIPRLRVDGVDSIPVIFKNGALEFDTNQTVTIS